MNTPMILSISSMFISVLCVLLCVWILGKTNNAALKMRLDDQEAYLDRLVSWYKKLNMNYARLQRERPSGAGTGTGNGEMPANADGPFAMRDGETPDDWKRRMRIEMAAGHLKHK